jgi:hypothetical protein
LSYAAITPDQLSTNHTIFTSEWNPDAPIEDLWKRTQECRRFATAICDPIMEPETVRTLFGMIEKAALLSNAVTDWRKRPQIEWTLDNFKIEITYANTERVRCVTVGNTDRSANAATTPPRHQLAQTPLLSPPTEPRYTTAGPMALAQTQITVPLPATARGRDTLTMPWLSPSKAAPTVS